MRVSTPSILGILGTACRISARKIGRRYRIGCRSCGSYARYVGGIGNRRRHAILARPRSAAVVEARARMFGSLQYAVAEGDGDMLSMTVSIAVNLQVGKACSVFGLAKAHAHP